MRGLFQQLRPDRRQEARDEPVFIARLVPERRRGLTEIMSGLAGPSGVEADQPRAAPAAARSR
jgi:hypothetical protein